MKKPVNNPVQGFLYNGVSEDEEMARRNETVAQIRERVEGDHTMEFGPAFLIEFSDGFQMVAYSAELRPYYQTD